MPVPRIEARLRREFSQVPITALEFYRSSGELLLLAGEDNALKIYEAGSGRRLGSINVFDEQSIQGIHIQPQSQKRDASTAPSKILVWGSSSVAILSLDDDADGELIVQVAARAAGPDWIYAGVINPRDACQIALATAHNEVVWIRHDEDAGELVFEETISPARPNLYSAALAWTGDEDDGCVLMAAGTAFGEIIMWKCWPGKSAEEPDQSKYEVLAVLTGHEGSIYGVDISPPLTLLDGGVLRFLATCSDDRTIRIWDVTERVSDAQKKQEHQPFDAPRETGFGATALAGVKPTNAPVAPVALAMGHVSRIWGVKIAAMAGSLLNHNVLYVYSFGEDSTVQKWKLCLNLDRGSPSPLSIPITGELTHCREFSLHDGKHLWSQSMLLLGEETLIATGGADSRISVIEDVPTPPSTQPHEAELSTEKQQAENTLQALDLEESIQSGEKRGAKKAEIVGRYAFLSADRLIATTSTGRLLIGSYVSDRLSWKQATVDEELQERLKRCYVMKRVTQENAVLGLTDGSLYFYNSSTDSVSFVSQLPIRITGISVLVEGEDTGVPTEILVHMFGVAKPQYLVLDPRKGQVQSQMTVLGLDTKFVAITATKVGDLLFIGSRHGWLSILQRKDDSYEQILNQAPRTNDAITAIVPLCAVAGDATPGSSLTFIATGRDGKYRVYEFTQGVEIPNLHLRHETSLPFGPMVEGGWVTNHSTPEIVLYGFRSNKFIVWNETRREERAAIDCGGAHRSFDFYHGGSDTDLMRLAFTRVSRLLIHSQAAIRHRALKRGTHGREIRALSSSGRIVATGSEDTTIRLWDYDYGRAANGTDEGVAQAEPRCLASVKAHVSGIQTLKWLDDQTLFSTGGNDELFVWRVQRLQPSYAGLAIQREAVFTDKSADGDLRIMDLDASRDEDTTTTAAGSVIVTLAFSNSAIKTYRYTAKDGFQLLISGAYTGACLTQVRHLEVPKDGGAMAIMTASTDGHVALWKSRSQTCTRQDDQQATAAKRLYAPVQVIKVHQSCIKCLDMIASGRAGFLMVTGGDDNALGIMTLRPLSPSRSTATTSDKDDVAVEGEKRACYEVASCRVIRRAHAAAINGLAIWRPRPEPERSQAFRGPVLAATASNDQRVKLWEIPEDGDDGVSGEERSRVVLLSDEYSGVADPGDVVLLPGDERRIAVAGVGLEVWSISDR